jgi:hypothetical protein
MQEFWFCARCSSMNRSDAERCYKCRAPKEQSTLATIRERKPGVVLTPGLDEEHREMAWMLMAGSHYTSAWKLGYLTAGLIIAFLVGPILVSFVIVAMAIASAVFPGLAHWVLIDPRVVTVVYTLWALLLPASFVLHGVFLALTSMNAPALGSGSPRFDPVRALLWPIETLLWLWWGVACFNLWPYVIGHALGMDCGPIGAIGKPRRLLEDLMVRLGVPEASDARLVTSWSAAWGALVGIVYAVALGPFLLLLLIIAMSRLGLVMPSQSGFALMLIAAAVVAMAAFTLAVAAFLFTLTRVTMEMAYRQRVRERWVFGGLRDAQAKAYAQAIDGTAQPTPAGQPAPAGQPTPTGQPTPAAQPTALAPVPDDTAPPAPEPPAAPTTAPTTAPVVSAPQVAVPASADDQVVWSRKVERLAPHTAAAQDGPPDLPDVWVRAIERAGATSATAAPDGAAVVQAPENAAVQPDGAADRDAAQTSEAQDRPVIQPSASTLSRYRTPLLDTEPTVPDDAPPSDLDVGGGI